MTRGLYVHWATVFEQKVGSSPFSKGTLPRSTPSLRVSGMQWLYSGMGCSNYKQGFSLFSLLGLRYKNNTFFTLRGVPSNRVYFGGNGYDSTTIRCSGFVVPILASGTPLQGRWMGSGSKGTESSVQPAKLTRVPGAALCPAPPA